MSQEAGRNKNGKYRTAMFLLITVLALYLMVIIKEW